MSTLVPLARDPFPFAAGGYRRCYIHPDDPDLCIKVALRPGDVGCDAEQQRDIWDSRALRKRGSETIFDHLAPVVAVVDTDLGVGIVQRLYRDADGTISRNCADLILEEGLTPPLATAIEVFKSWLRKESLPTRGLTPDNLVAVRSSEQDKLELILIEGLLNRKLDLLARCCRICSDHLVERRLRGLDARIAKLVANRESDL